MWDELREQVDVERGQLEHLIDVHRSLLDKCAAEEPSQIEVSAFGGMLQSFYNGIENVFKRIAQQANQSVSEGESWHKSLLERMARSEGTRGPVISTALKERLTAFLQFRHFYRHGYVYQLEWNQMKRLVIACEEVFRETFEQIDRFLAEQT